MLWLGNSNFSVLSYVLHGYILSLFCFLWILAIQLMNKSNKLEGWYFSLDVTIKDVFKTSSIFLSQTLGKKCVLWVLNYSFLVASEVCPKEYSFSSTDKALTMQVLLQIQNNLILHFSHNLFQSIKKSATKNLRTDSVSSIKSNQRMSTICGD